MGGGEASTNHQHAITGRVCGFDGSSRLGKRFQNRGLTSVRLSDSLKVGHIVTSNQTSKVGKRGVVVLPAKLRERFGIDEGSLVIAEEHEQGILIRPAVVVPVEVYSPERKAEFLLSNAVDKADYREARKAVEALGFDPDKIPHHRRA